MNQKGIVTPLILVMLLMGLVVGVYLVQQRTNLFSKAAYIQHPPIIQDDFSSAAGWENLGVDQDSIREFNPSENNMKIYFRKADNRISSIYKKISHSGGFTSMIDITIHGESDNRSAGVSFGSQANNMQSLLTGRVTRIAAGQPFKLRVDAFPTQVKLWVSTDRGITWRLISTAEDTFDVSPYLGANREMYIGLSARTADRTPLVTFDNLKIWRLGDLPEPGVSASATPTLTPRPDGGPQIFSSSIKANFSDANAVVEIPGRNFGNSGTVYYSTGGTHEATARVKSWTADKIEVYKRISEPTTVNGLDAVDIIGNRYIRVCRYPNYACTEYVLMPVFQ